MNAGNKSRGQADGFLLDSLSKTQSIKDSEGRSILQILCKNHFEEDPSFADFKQDYSNCYAGLKCIAEDITKDSVKVGKDLQTHKGLFEMILKQDPDVEDLPYGKIISKFMVNCEKNV